MAYKKGVFVEHGIWRRAEDKGYLVEVSVTCADTGKRIRKRKTIGRLDLARAWRDTVKADGLRGEITREEKRKEITFEDFADEYLSVWGQKRRASTVSRERTLIEGVLKPCFNTRDLRSITRRDIEIHIAKRLSGEISIKRKDGIKVSSANRELCRLKHMLAMAEDWGYIEQSPARSIKQEREYPGEAGYLEADEVPKVLEACPAWLQPIVVVAVHTGLRWGELMALEWKNVDFERRLVTVGDSKNHDVRHVPLNDTVLRALSTHRRVSTKETGRISPRVFANPKTGSAYHHCARAFKKAAMKSIGRPLTFHCTRHTAASHFVMAGVDLRTVGQILGHRTPQMTMRYAHLAPEHLQDAANKLGQRLNGHFMDTEGEMKKSPQEGGSLTG
jgi:integrase